ncbi:MAG: sigma-54-dependent Fis family transcriptional regulator [Pirellulaceae bacterium]|nr:sigma-54-dependent Fis family transcriptional regulator [Pirellulaceae bacterium]
MGIDLLLDLTELWQAAFSFSGLHSFLSKIAVYFEDQKPQVQGIGVMRYHPEDKRFSVSEGLGNIHQLQLACDAKFLRERSNLLFERWFEREVVTTSYELVTEWKAPADWPLQDSIVWPFKTESGNFGLVVLACDARPQDLSQISHTFAQLRGPMIAAFEIECRLEQIKTMNAAVQAERENYSRKLGLAENSHEIVGAASGLKLVMERVELVAQSDVPVLILGETGTGKELIAREIHLRSPFKKGPFIRVNCGAIPAELIDSQLFGHEKGSFTGAERQRLGWFERANQGTLFLDEIGELPLDAQIRLLRVLQDGFLERVGGNEPIHVQVRVVAATHRDLATMVSDKSFREDLWYRLAVFPIFLPPLRDRKSDIPAMVRRFLTRAASRFTLPPVTPDESHFRLLAEYDWPGNIRELAAVIDRAVILGNGKSLEIDKALGILPNKTTSPERPIEPGRTVQDSLQIEPLEITIRRQIERALGVSNGRIEGESGAARRLQINPNTLRGKMRKLGINGSAFRRRESS